MSDVAYRSLQNPCDFGTEHAVRNFQIASFMSRVAGSIPVVVRGVNASAGTVDIQPLVNLIDGESNTMQHGTIYGCPYYRMQAGNSAIIIDPVVGDNGIAIFADRDISNVIATHGVSAPGSSRMHDMSDGMYFGGILNPQPTQFIRFDAGGITITSPVNVQVNAPTVSVTASTSATVTAPAISMGASGQSLLPMLNSSLLTWLNTHVHGNGNGGANTTQPTSTPAATTQTTTVKAG